METPETPSKTSSAEPEQTTHSKGTDKSTQKTIIRDLGIEMIAVIAGILIALFIDNIREDHYDRRLLESTLESLVEELNKNEANIHIFLPRQVRFLDTLQHYREDDTYSIADIGSKTGGMGIGTIHMTNWQLSLNSNSLQFLNFETVNLLSQINAKHQEILEQDKFFTLLFLVRLYPHEVKKGLPIEWAWKNGSRA